jgi:rhodanese-related sulfurtransferase
MGGGVEAFNLAGGIEAWKQAGLPVEVDRAVSRISIMRQVQIVAGSFVLAGAALAYWVSPWFLIVPAFFGAGLLFAGLSGTCGMAALLSVMPWNRAAGQGAHC